LTFTHAGLAHTVTHTVTLTLDLSLDGECNQTHGDTLFVHVVRKPLRVPGVRVLLRLPRGCGLRSFPTGFLAQASLLLLWCPELVLTMVREGRAWCCCQRLALLRCACDWVTERRAVANC
jgi:hypothetical protein